MSLDEHRHGFAAAMAALVAEFNTYLDQAHADPTEDKVDTSRSHYGSMKTNSTR